MTELYTISNILLLEQDSKMMDLRKAIIERKPISIQYSGPPEEVLSGPRYDIEPIVMGTNAKSGNLVIWAYVFRGVSKKGIPGWKMFRVDRIQSIDADSFNKDSFKLEDLPGYQQGKAPNAMKSLSRVDIYSPYWFEGYKKNQKKPYQPAPPAPEPKEVPTTEPTTAPTEVPTSPDLFSHKLDIIAFNKLKAKVQDVDGQKTVTNQEYQDTLNNLYKDKEGEWKRYQSMVSGNVRPGEGTRNRFKTYGKKEIDDLLSQNGITVSNEVNNMVAEIQKRFKDLIFS